ncbi:MAG: hypothetical protein ACQEWI_09230 [Bacillota bacterium]
MFGTVEYFTDYFKTCIMNNFSGEKTLMLSSNYQRLTKEIMMRIEKREEKEVCLSNLERAYNKMSEELFGDRRKR